MSFRRRLTLFFVLIVVLPMVAVAVLVTQLSRESSTGRRTRGSRRAMESALSLYDGGRCSAHAEAEAGVTPDRPVAETRSRTPQQSCSRL